MYWSRNVTLCKNIVHLEAQLLLTNVWPFRKFVPVGTIPSKQTISFFYPTNVNWQLDQTKNRTQRGVCLFFFLFFGRPTRTFLLRVINATFFSHTHTHTRNNNNNNNNKNNNNNNNEFLHSKHQFDIFFSQFYDRRWREREREIGRVIETNAQTYRMLCVRGLG